MVWQAADKDVTWFDWLTTNGYISTISIMSPFSLSTSKGERRFFFSRPARRHVV
jgi:hypothetical protein